MTRQPLKVPVSIKKVVGGKLTLEVGGMLHDTAYAKGAIDLDTAAREWADDAIRNGHNRWSPEYVMAEVAPFMAQLHLVDSTKYRSAVFFTFMDTEGNRWPMFVTDLTEMLSKVNMVNGWTEPLTFETCKRGTAYGIRLVP